ncbi:G-protein coupled receptor [Trichinella pseudospiralis]
MERTGNLSSTLAIMTQTNSSTVTLSQAGACNYEMMEFLEVKFWLIVVAGSVVYSFGMITNLMLLVVLLKRSLRSTYLIYLSALCVSDIGILVTYFMVFPVQILYDYCEMEWLYFLWLRYVPYLYTVSRILTVASTYLVVVCSAERYMEVTSIKPLKMFYEEITQKKRCWLVYNQECIGFAAVELQLTEMARNPLYQKVYQLWLVHIVQVFFPFLALVLINHLIITNWRGVVKKAIEMESNDSHNLNIRHSSRSAWKMMVAIVTSYLMQSVC